MCSKGSDPGRERDNAWPPARHRPPRFRQRAGTGAGVPWRSEKRSRGHPAARAPWRENNKALHPLAVIAWTGRIRLFGRDGHRREKPGGQPATAGIARGRAAVRLFPVFCSFRCLLCVLVCPSGEKLNMRKLASLLPVPSFVRTEPVGVMGNVCLATAAFCLANGRLPRPAVKPRAAFPTTLSISYLASCSPASVFSGGTPPSRREAEAGACLMLCVSGKNDTASLLGRKKLLKKQPAKGIFTYLCSVKFVSPEERNENSCEDIVSPNQRKDGR